MLSIKHSKFKNTGIIFELLTKQIAVDIIDNKSSIALTTLKK